MYEPASQYKLQHLAIGMVCYNIIKCVITSGYVSDPVQAEPSVALPAYKPLPHSCKGYIVDCCEPQESA